jgi:hypothetical protein
MTADYLEVIIDDVKTLLLKKGRASDMQYLVILKRLNILKEKLTDVES